MISLKMIKMHRYKTPPRLCVLLGYNWGSDSKRKVIQCSMNSQNENETPSPWIQRVAKLPEQRA